MYKRYGQCVAALVRKSWARLSWLSWLLAAVAFGFRAFVASGFCGFWLSWLSWLLASVAFGFRGLGGFWILCGFWLSWLGRLSWLLDSVAFGFWLSWLSSHAKERRKEGGKEGRQEGSKDEGF